MYPEASESALSGTKRSIFNTTKSLFCAIKLTNIESVCLETHNDSVSRSSHHFFFSKWSYILPLSMIASQNMTLAPLVMTYFNWRTMVGGDLEFDQLI